MAVEPAINLRTGADVQIASKRTGRTRGRTVQPGDLRTSGRAANAPAGALAGTTP